MYRRLGTPAKKVQQIGKSPFLFFGFSICKICWKSQIWSWFVDLEPLEDVGSIWSEQFCIFSRQQASPLAALACLGLPEFSEGLGRSVATKQKCHFAIFKCFLRLPEAPKPKKKAIFRVSRSSLIFGAPGRHRKYLKIVKLYFFTSTGKPTDCTSLPGTPRKFRETQAGQCSQWAGRKRAKIQFCNFQTLPTPSRSPKTKKEGNFWAQHEILHMWSPKTENGFFPDLLHFFRGSTPPWVNRSSGPNR